MNDVNIATAQPKDIWTEIRDEERDGFAKAIVEGYRHGPRWEWHEIKDALAALLNPEERVFYLQPETACSLTIEFMAKRGAAPDDPESFVDEFTQLVDRNGEPLIMFYCMPLEPGADACYILGEREMERRGLNPYNHDASMNLLLLNSMDSIPGSW